MKNSPIGVFDSGFGGLTILKEILQVLPEHDFIYMGDNARAPYGDKDFEKVHEYTLQSVQWFFQQGCPLVILACNTASAKALRTIQQKDLPFIDSNKRVLGVIRPTSEVIGSFSQSKHIGVLGTTGTIQSQSYIIEIEKFSPDIIVSQEACPEWVSLIEKNEMETPDEDYHVKIRERARQTYLEKTADIPKNKRGRKPKPFDESVVSIPRPRGRPPINR